ncbi:MAG: hypothetical protein MI784_00370 [Cytophagales bacterium]|nr:hypothetical protein [Cytophagales bacterium]
MIKKSLFTWLLIGAAAGLVIITCSHDKHSNEAQQEHEPSLIDKIKTAGKTSPEVEVSVNPYKLGIQTIKIKQGGREFLVPKRIEHLINYPCASCHTVPLSQLALSNTDKKRAHWNIKLKHASADVMNCQTCHAPGNLNVLHSLTGKEISYDESFKNCQQCHSLQFKDWLGGSHGKRLGGWAPPVIKQTCVNCHDPHDPSFKPRWPARYNVLVFPESQRELNEQHRKFAKNEKK